MPLGRKDHQHPSFSAFLSDCEKTGCSVKAVITAGSRCPLPPPAPLLSHRGQALSCLVLLSIKLCLSAVTQPHLCALPVHWGALHEYHFAFAPGPVNLDPWPQRGLWPLNPAVRGSITRWIVSAALWCSWLFAGGMAGAVQVCTAAVCVLDGPTGTTNPPESLLPRHRSPSGVAFSLQPVLQLAFSEPRAFTVPFGSSPL